MGQAASSDSESEKDGEKEICGRKKEVGGGNQEKYGWRNDRNKYEYEYKIKSLMRAVSRESTSNVQRHVWRNGGLKKPEGGREEEKRDAGRNLEI